MRLYTRIEKFFDLILKYIFKVIMFLHELKNIKLKKNLYSKVKFSKSQIQEVDAIWRKNYGKKISKKWHRLYQSYLREYDSYYFPEILYSTKLEPKMNPRHISRVFSDKAFTDILIDDKYVRTPKTVILNANNIFYDSDRRVINQKNALSNLKNIGEVVIKPTVNTGSGKGVRLINVEEGIDKLTGDSIETIIFKYKKNFIIQEKLVAHHSYKVLHENSINTLRVITYIVDGEVYCAPLALRIGVTGSFVDNAHAGGIVIGLSDDGILRDKGFTEFQESYTIHPDSGVIFDGHNVVKTYEVIEAAKRLHGRIPNLGIVSWDFMVDVNESIVLIEINLTSQTIWFPQYANGKAIFGENTEKLIRMISRR